MSISGILFLVITIAVLLGCAAVFAVYMILYRKRLNSALYTDMKQGAKGMAARDTCTSRRAFQGEQLRQRQRRAFNE